MKRLSAIALLLGALPFAQATAQPAVPPMPNFTTEQVCPDVFFGSGPIGDTGKRICVSEQQSGLYVMRGMWPLVSAETRKNCTSYLSRIPPKDMKPGGTGLTSAYSTIGNCLLALGRNDLIDQMPTRLDYR